MNLRIPESFDFVERYHWIRHWIEDGTSESRDFEKYTVLFLGFSLFFFFKGLGFKT